jgi:hypothetical protein
MVALSSSINHQSNARWWWSAYLMPDHEGDISKKPDICKKVGITRCPNMVEVGGGLEGELYRCSTCGATYYLDYEEMK